MKESTLETPIARTPLSLLLIGPPGSGKSTLALQFPSVAVADCDQNLAGPERYLRKNKRFKPFFYENIVLDDAGKPLTGKEKWAKLLRFIQEAAKKPEVKTIVVDGLTQVNDILTQTIMEETKRSVMEIQDWGTFRRYLTTLITLIRSCGKDTITICHEVIERDKQGSVVAYTPALSSNIKDFLGGFFTDMWRCTTTLGRLDAVEFNLRTVSTAVSDLKNSFQMPPDIKAVTFDEVVKHIVW